MENEQPLLSAGSDRLDVLADGKANSYRLGLQSGEFVQLTILQQGVDVAFELFAPDGSGILTGDSPIGRFGPERVLAVAEQPGDYRLEVRAADSRVPTGEYRITVDELRLATPDDRVRAAAEITFADAEELRRQGTKEALERAAEGYEQARDSWQGLGDLEREADTLHRLGWLQDSLGQPGNALPFFESAVDGYRRAGVREREAVALNFLSQAQSQLGTTDQAFRTAEQALTIFRELDDRGGIASVLINLGIYHRRRGRIGDALTAYEGALVLVRELGDREKEASVLGSLGALLNQQGQFREAADHIEQALAIWTSQGNLNRSAAGLNRLGEIRKRQGRLDEAVEHLERALDLRRQSGNRRGEATSLNSLGTALLLSHRVARAEECYLAAMEIYREIGDSRGKAIAWLNLGRSSWQAGRYRKAFEFHEQASDYLRQLGDRQLEASNHFGSAQALHQLGEYEAARQRLELTLSYVEELRLESHSDAFRVAFFATKQHYYDLYIDVLMHLHEQEPDAGHAHAAFEAGERRRARALLDMLGEAAVEIRQDSDPALVAEEASLQLRLNDLERKRTKLVRREAEPEAIAKIEKGTRQARMELDQIRRKIRSSSPRYAALTQPQPASLKEIQNQMLDRRTLLLAYSLGEERSFLFVVSRDRFECHIVAGRGEIEQAAAESHRLLTQVNSRSEVRLAEQLELTSQLLLGAVAERLDQQRLLIVAEDGLLYLPFAVLPLPGNASDGPSVPLVARHEIVSLPSASILLTLRREVAGRYPAPKQLAIFADPVVSLESQNPHAAKLEEGAAESKLLDSFESLPHTRNEADVIARLAGGSVMKAIGFEANKSNVVDGRLEDFQILHFATHGILNREHPELSGLVLSLFDSQGQPQDGFLRTHEIYNLRLPAELVVLSACSTGLGREIRGEGLVGLTRGFMYAGAPRVMVSLWNVKDDTTAELMKRFYWSLLERGAAPAKALRAAQLSMQQDEALAHPSDWAGFVLLGDWRRPGASADVDLPIESAAQGDGVDDEEDIDLPGGDVDDDWFCENLSEPWTQGLCRILNSLDDARS